MGRSGARSSAIRRPGLCSSSKFASGSRKSWSLFAKPVDAPARAAKPKLFDNLRKFELMAFGVPTEWTDDVRGVNEDTLFDVISHPDALRRFRILGDGAELCPNRCIATGRRSGYSAEYESRVGYRGASPPLPVAMWLLARKVPSREVA
jgi:hypothetical protein